MPTIAEAAQLLAAEGLPILLVDTCILLDVIRAPQRRIQFGVQSAVELAEMQAQSSCRIVASSMVQDEWNEHEQDVMQELDRHLAIRDLDALAFHEACDLVKIPISFGMPAYQTAGLAARMRDLSSGLLKNAIQLLSSNETTIKASDRTRARKRPARQGGGHQDCIIIEEYLELCRLLKESNFARKLVFCSSNTKDYEVDQDLDKSLASEFSSVGLIYTNMLHWAVNELKKA